MGHDHHFLSRLDRAATGEVELALSLYRDHKLIREVLSHAKLPDGAERVAISLADPEAGPFIVVARDGGFVTCLGRGMHPNGLPVITRAKLDAISLRVGRLREGLQMAVDLTGGHVNRLFVRIYTAGPMLSREEIIALSAIMPLLSPQLFLLVFAAASEAQSARVALRKVASPHGRDGKRAERAWGELWAVGHLTALIGDDARKHLGDVDPKDRWLVGDLPSLVFQQCVFSLSFRGVWAAAKLGKALLPTLKQKLTDIPSVVGIVSSVTSLNAIAHGPASLRAEAKKALLFPPFPETHPAANSMNRLRLSVRAMVEDAEAHAHEAEDLAIELGRSVAAHWLRRGPAGSVRRYEREEDVPADVARAFIAWHLGYSGQEHTELSLLFRLAPWIVKLRTTDLFLPAELLESVRLPASPALAHAVLQRPFESNWVPRPRPDRAQRTPSRNDPCACGSGKKYKRCCG